MLYVETNLDDSQRYTCLHPGCEANFSNVGALDTHVYSHFSHEEPDSTCRNLQSAVANMGLIFSSTVTYRSKQSKPCECAVCGLAFERVSDFMRHFKKHDPNAPRFNCRVEGCPYKGQKGFYRKDKLMSHVKCRHWQLAMGKNEQDGQRGNLVEQN